MRAREHFRAHARRKVTFTAGIRRHGSNGQLEKVSLRDIGVGGACIEFPKPTAIEVQSAVTVEISTPNLWDPLVLKGRIAWFKSGRAEQLPRAGIRFEHGEHGGLLALWELLGSQSYEP